MNETETYYHIFGNQMVLTLSDILAIIGIIVSFGVGGLFYYLDWRRKNEIERGHKKIICSHMDELNKIFSQIMIDVNMLDENEITISERLNQFLTRKYRHIEFLVNNIKLHQLQCTKLSEKEIKDIEDTITASQWLLEQYFPQDVPEQFRPNLWRKYNPQLKEQALKLANSVKDFVVQ